MLDINSYDYNLPAELIAQTPLQTRSDSQLLRVNRNGGYSDGVFCDIKDILKKGDCLVVNNTRVIPARLIGEGKNGGAVELLLLNRLDASRWEALVKPGKRMRQGDAANFGGELGCVVEGLLEDGGTRIISFKYSGVFEEILDRLGRMPLPPYITEELTDNSRYQTVYARHNGSAAAPTAGLHFTPELLGELTAMGVSVANVTLHVGLGTFRPVKAEKITEHKMHSERFTIEKNQADIINLTRENGGRIVAVGTTSVRALETAAMENGIIMPGSGDTEIFIYPGYRFKAADILITNFHLPKSTLLMLVSAFGGYENVMAAYRHAVQEKYRFFSFGDAMVLM